MQKAPAYKLNFFKPNKAGLIEGSFGFFFFLGGGVGGGGVGVGGNKWQ